jgi:Fe2+ or Zn2+ uptake regulation protein
MNNKVEKLIKDLQNRGYRDSRLKRRIIELIFLSKKPISVPDIIQKLDIEKVPYNKSSLYREIDKLLSEQIIIEIDLLDGKKRYELNNHIHHHHALCTKCGSVICVDIPNNLEEVEAKLLQKKGFKVTGHVLEFFGMCEKCKKL